MFQITPQLVQMGMQMLMGKGGNDPRMQQFSQMMSGKNQQQQFQTLLNLAKSRGLDVDAKMFSREDLQNLGLKVPPCG